MTRTFDLLTHMASILCFNTDQTSAWYICFIPGLINRSVLYLTGQPSFAKIVP
jgi:hypothetical protein